MNCISEPNSSVPELSVRGFIDALAMSGFSALDGDGSGGGGGDGLMNKNLKMNDTTSNAYSLSNFNGNKDMNGNQMNIRKQLFKTLPSTETLPRKEILGGYIFICNNDSMHVDLMSRLFCLPPRYRDSVRAITPGLPLFLYNFTTRRLHGIFEAASFGGSNIDPTAWEDIHCKGESMYPAQVRIRLRKICRPLEEDEFRPILHHYYGPRFRFELSIAETLALLDLYEKQDVEGSKQNRRSS